MCRRKAASACLKVLLCEGQRQPVRSFEVLLCVGDAASATFNSVTVFRRRIQPVECLNVLLCVYVCVCRRERQPVPCLKARRANNLLERWANEPKRLYPVALSVTKLPLLVNQRRQFHRLDKTSRLSK